MKVDVEHRLACGLAAIVDEPKALFFEMKSARNFRGPGYDIGNDMLVPVVHFCQGSDVLPGNDEDVSWGLRVDVFESNHVIALEHFSRGDIAADDPAEQAQLFSRLHRLDVSH